MNDAQTTQYLVEDDVNPTGLPQVVEELVNNSVTRQYTYGLQRISESQFINNVWTTSFYVYDGFGTVRQLSDSTGTVTDQYEYDAFGNSFTKTGSTPNNYLYRGEQFDSDLGLYYLRARYYDPATGRFLSRDPESGHPQLPMTLHKYLYANGDPVNRIDPRGREAWLDFAVLAFKAIQAIPVLNAISCGINIGIMLGEGTLLQSLANPEGPADFGLGAGGLASTAYGCLTMAATVDTTTVGLGDYLGLAGCALGFAQDVYDMNKYFKDPTEANYTTFEIDWTGGMIGCLPPLMVSLL